MRTQNAITCALALGLLWVATGCMVPLKKYKALEAERDRLTQLLEEREKDLSAAQDAFRKRFEDASRELDLYKKQAGDSKASAEAAQRELDEAHKQAKQFEDQIKALGVGEVRDGRLVLEGSLLFALGEDTITSNGKRVLDKVAGAFKGKDVLIQIDGHTDTTPIVKPRTKQAHQDNMGLSAHRAIAVCRHLASKGIAERNMFVRAFGPSWPVASNATAASKARNRRVEILFIPASLVRRPAPK